MNAEARTVRRLHLRAPNEALARRGLLRIEDALRTASLPGGGRIVVVRRLALGRFDADASSQSLALRIEARLRDSRASIIHGLSADASAPTVWFRDALEAHVSLALRLARGDSTREWFWPQAISGWTPAQSGTDGLRWLAFSLTRLPEAATALPQWCAQLWHAGHGPGLHSALHSGDGAALLQALRISSDFDGALPASSSRSLLAPASDEVARSNGAAPPGVIDDRDRFLRRMLIAAGVSLRASGPDGEPMQAAASSPSAGSESDVRSSPARRPPTDVEARHFSAIASLATQVSGQETSAAARRVSPAAIAADALKPRTDSPATTTSAIAASVDESSIETGPAFRASDRELAATKAGGLLFLLPVLARLGYREWLAASPRWRRQALVQRLFQLVLARLRVAPDDPAFALAEAPTRSRQRPRQFVAPPQWQALGSGHRGDAGHRIHDRSGRLLLAQSRAGQQPETDDLPAAVTRAWLIACRRWLRRQAGIGLADLVLRPAQLSLTPTHADLHFPLAAMELRVRRAGLDIDPGWVPWLGRVVAFHYGEATQP